MTGFEVNWHVIFLNIIPFAAAQLFLIVLVYFTLVRERIAKEYPYYAVFLSTFILYLSSTLVSIMPLEMVPYIVHYTACTLLYTFGFPALTVALFLQSKLTVPKAYILFSASLGLAWSVFYYLTADFINVEVNLFTKAGELPEVPDWLHFSNVYLAQSLLIMLVLVLPGIYLLKRTQTPSTKIFVFGMMSLAAFAMVGSLIEHWAVYYAGSSLCAFAWGGGLFKDIQQLNEKAKAHHLIQKDLASAQFATKAEGVTLEDLYPDTLDETYPFREKEELLEAVRTASKGLIEARVTQFVNALSSFARQDNNVLKARLRELLFLLTDTSIFYGGPAKQLVMALESKGQKLDACSDLPSAINFLIDECLTLIAFIELPSRQTSTDVLVDRIKSYILAHYHKESLNADTVAQEIGVSRSHAMKSFKNKYGVTLSQYINQVRLEKAKSFLLEMSVTETAFEVGFRSANYFSTFFTKHSGVSPKQFQQQAKGQP